MQSFTLQQSQYYRITVIANLLCLQNRLIHQKRNSYSRIVNTDIQQISRGSSRVGRHTSSTRLDVEYLFLSTNISSCSSRPRTYKSVSSTRHHDSIATDTGAGDKSNKKPQQVADQIYRHHGEYNRKDQRVSHVSTITFESHH